MISRTDRTTWARRARQSVCGSRKVEGINGSVVSSWLFVGGREEFRRAKCNGLIYCGGDRINEPHFNSVRFGRRPIQAVEPSHAYRWRDIYISMAAADLARDVLSCLLASVDWSVRTYHGSGHF